MAAQEWDQKLDLDRPSPARVYDYFLGGSHNFAADREMAARLTAVMPDIGEIMRANRAFLRRAVAYLVDAGVRQFLDLGSGVPTVGNVHEIAQGRAPEARIVYVDIDPVAVAHSTSILDGNDGAGIVPADLRDVDDVLAHPTLRRLLDLSEPIGLLLVGVLHQLPGDQPLKTIRRYRDAMAPGSYLALSQASADGRPTDAPNFKQEHDRGYGPREDMALRSRAEVARFFEGFDLVEPGLLYLSLWRPDGPLEEDPERVSSYGAVGRLRGTS